MNALDYTVTIRGEIPADISETISRAHADAVRILDLLIDPANGTESLHATGLSQVDGDD